MMMTPNPLAPPAVQSTEGPDAREVLWREAEAFYRLPELSHLPKARLAEVRRAIETDGSYQHTPDELLIGAKVAWRNHARCIGRMHWRSLRLLDFRHCRTAEEVAQACWEHLRQSTNKGQLRSVITIFAPRTAQGEIRILNPQLIRYAGYRQADGTVIGDPLHVEITELAQALGWNGTGGAFDVLPVIIQMPGDHPRAFDVPADALLEVPISHPELPGIAELGLKWHANPAVSNMGLEIGGISYTAAPFSGWYVGSEIGARNLSDTYRYDVLPDVAACMGLDTRHDRTLWKDRALVELTYAVLHSYRQAGVLIVDHHSAARQFLNHVDAEGQAGRPVPTQWSWVNPPLSASATPTYHRTYDAPDFGLRPNFVSQDTVLSCPVTGAVRAVEQ